MRDNPEQPSAGGAAGRTLTPGTVLVPRRDVRFRAVGEETVVLRQQAAEMLVLNEVAGALLGLLDGHRDLDTCAALLGERFAVGADRVRADVLAFAGLLVEEELAEPAERQALPKP